MGIPQKGYENIARLRVVAVRRGHYTQDVQRLFSMFPQGGPGLALLLLRISVAAIFLISLASWFGVSSAPLIFGGASLIFISLVIGFLTPYLSLVACAVAVANLLFGTRELVCVIPILDALALGLLGPGAYSVDARLFGLRVSVIPPRNEKDAS